MTGEPMTRDVLLFWRDEAHIGFNPKLAADVVGAALSYIDRAESAEKRLARAVELLRWVAEEWDGTASEPDEVTKVRAFLSGKS